jgi:uncharacterized membrane protein
MGSTRDAVLAIVGMAVVTYATRASGVWLLQRVPLSRTLERGLGYLPSAVLVALIAPAVVNAGPAGLLGLVASVMVAARTKNVVLTTLVGVSVVCIVRRFM